MTIELMQVPLSKVDFIASALKNGWTYVSRKGNVVTLQRKKGETKT